MKPWVSFLSAGLLAALTSVASADDVKVFVVAGQSNALGYGDESILPPGLVSQTDVLYDFWNTTARLPDGDYSTSVSTDWGPLEAKALQPGGARHFGPEVTFARAVADAMPDKRVAILKASGQGTNILEHWEHGRPPDPDYPEKSQLYHALFGSLDPSTYETLAYPAEPTRLDAALGRLEAKGHTFEIAAVVWVQGENEAAWSAAYTYEEHLRGFIDSVRADLDSPALPFVVLRLSLNGSQAKGGPFSDAGVDAVRMAQTSIASSDPNVALVDVDDLPPEMPGGFHFTSEGYLTIGERLADAYLAMNGGEGGGPGSPSGGAGGGTGGMTAASGGAGGTDATDDADDSKQEDGCTTTREPVRTGRSAGLIALGLLAITRCREMRQSKSCARRNSR